MNTGAQISGVLHSILTEPTGGVVRLVDDLLRVCAEHGLNLDWQTDRVRFQFRGSDWEELTDIRLRQSAFRAVLARIATLCNDRNPNSVSPYGGRGELSVGESPAPVFQVSFVNSPTVQRLELIAPTRTTNGH